MRFWYYVLFVFVAAPIEIQLDFWSGLEKGQADLLWRPLAEALLYTYALVLAAETAFRLAVHREAFQRKAHLHLLTCGVIAVLFLFSFHYLLSLRPMIEQGRSVQGSWILQVAALLIGIATSLFSYHAVERAGGKPNPSPRREST